jgi:hypothetical protein
VVESKKDFARWFDRENQNQTSKKALSFKARHDPQNKKSPK